jgi:hypothetical protein
VTEKHSLTPDQMYPVLRYFEFDHLPEPLKEVSRQFHEVAHKFADLLPYCPETSAGLRKLLEAKDCFVRAALDD